MHEVPLPDEPPHARLGGLVKNWRKRIAPSAVTLGNFLRYGDRIGKPVTQEEIAEAIGISRVWYATIESGGASHVSPGVLGRLADALMLNAGECELLYALGIPYLSESHLKNTVSASLDSLWTLRWASKRLWSASSFDEALTVATEAASPHFKDAVLIFFVRQIEQARWEHPYVVDRGVGERNTAFYNELVSTLAPSRVDEAVLYPTLSQPGDVGTDETYKTTSIGRLHTEALEKFRLDRWSLIHGRVRSRAGMVGGITIKHDHPHDYTAFERLLLGQLCAMASLALDSR